MGVSQIAQEEMSRSACICPHVKWEFHKLRNLMYGSIQNPHVSVHMLIGRILLGPFGVFLWSVTDSHSCIWVSDSRN